MPTPAFAINDVFFLCVWGLITFSAPGTFGLTCGEGTTGDTFAVEAGSIMALTPVVSTLG
jgi:hypothetical protein